MKNEKSPLMVTIKCLAYNQAPYIRQCLDGFVMQQTTFRFEAIVHDDASTDGTADIIREYAEKYPDIIIPIIETENQYSKRDGSLRRIMDSHTHGKYVAICEGDDYWTDPMKLQKQVEYMESHNDCSMCFHSHWDLFPDNSKRKVAPEQMKQRYIVQDIISIKNGIIATNSIMYRNLFLLAEGKPDFWNNCPVGDIPMRLYFASKGYIGYLNEPMSVYRREAEGSWTSKKRTSKQIIEHRRKIIEMYEAYDKYTGGKYKYHIRREIWKLRLKTIGSVFRRVFQKKN